MSQRNVERVIGRLVTDERFRREFAADPRRTLQSLTQEGFELTGCELQALVTIDPRPVQRLADAINPQLQKADIQGGAR